MTILTTIGAGLGRAFRHLAGRFFPVWHYPTPEAAEWLSARSGLWWCLLLTPRFHLFASNILFAGFRHLAPERVWQTGMCIVIFAQILAQLLGGRGVRAGMLLLSALVWAFAAGVTGAAAPRYGWLPLTTGIGIYSSLAADCAVGSIFLCRQIYTDWLCREGVQHKGTEPQGGTPWGD